MLPAGEFQAGAVSDGNPAGGLSPVVTRRASGVGDAAQKIGGRICGTTAVSGGYNSETIGYSLEDDSPGRGRSRLPPPSLFFGPSATSGCMIQKKVTRRRRPRLICVVVLLAVSIVGGCGKTEEIRSYLVSKELGDRMLAAIVPAPGRAWFFKVVGSQPTVDEHADEINKFFTTIRVPEGDRAQWDLPPGWREEAGSQMRAATLWIPADGKPLEMSVSALPWSGTEDDMLRNVNRWRTQMDLPQIGPAELSESTREVEAGDVKITVADLTGKFQGGPAMGPFASGAMPGGTPPSGGDRASGAESELPAGHPPLGDVAGSRQTGPSSAAPDRGGPTYDVPKSWQESSVDPAGMRRAAFSIGEGEQQALVTVIDFSANAPQIADPLENVNRWRREIGMSALEQDELSTVTEAIEMDGHPATYAKVVPDPSKPAESKIEEATLAAMAPHGDRVWFIKMRGPRELVAAQEEEFRSFLNSIRFPADGGANDGN